MTYYVPEEYRCCGMHVRKGAQIIGIIGLIIGIFILLGAMFYSHTVGSYLDGIITIIIYTALIVASQNHQPKWYLPFLVLNMLFIVFKVLYLLFLIFMLVTMPPSWQRYVNKYEMQREHITRFNIEDEARIQTGAMIAILTIGLLLNIWFQHIVYKAYKSLKEEHDLAPHQMPATTSVGIATTTTTTRPHIVNVPVTLPAGKV